MVTPFLFIFETHTWRLFILKKVLSEKIKDGGEGGIRTLGTD